MSQGSVMSSQNFPLEETSQVVSSDMVAIAKKQRVQDFFFHRITQSFSLLVLLALFHQVILFRHVGRKWLRGISRYFRHCYYILCEQPGDSQLFQNGYLVLAFFESLHFVESWRNTLDLATSLSYFSDIPTCFFSCFS